MGKSVKVDLAFIKLNVLVVEEQAPKFCLSRASLRNHGYIYITKQRKMATGREVKLRYFSISKTKRKDL